MNLRLTREKNQRNRWYPYSEHIAAQRYRYGYDEMIERINHLMELAFDIGRKEERRERDKRNSKTGP